MTTLTITQVHRATKRYLPPKYKEILLRLLNDFSYGSFPNRSAKMNRRSPINKGPLTRRYMDNLISKITDDFTKIHKTLQLIHTSIVEEQIVIEHPEKDYETMKKTVQLLTEADEFFAEVDYFNNAKLKQEIKQPLHISYLIEAILKLQIIRKKNHHPQKDELFAALATKSKESLSRVL